MSFILGLTGIAIGKAIIGCFMGAGVGAAREHQDHNARRDQRLAAYEALDNHKGLIPKDELDVVIPAAVFTIAEKMGVENPKALPWMADDVVAIDKAKATMTNEKEFIEFLVKVVGTVIQRQADLDGE